MDKREKAERRAIEFEALITDTSAVACEIQGMKAENEQRKAMGHSMAYVEDSFLTKAEELKEISRKLRALCVS